MSKNIIVVQNVFNNPEITRNSIESIRHAAKRWGADFYELNTIQHPNSFNPFFLDRIWEYQNFTNYEKVLVLDPDIVINIKAPNIFDELTPEYDFCAVRDGNPGERFSDPNFLRETLAKNNATMGNTISVFQKNIDGFSYEKYWNNFFNLGVTLFYPQKINKVMDRIKNLIITNSEIYNYVNFNRGGIWFSPQNLINAIFTVEDVRIKFLEDKWNWILPDIINEYNEDFYLGPMKPWIYHFTGTDGSKEELMRYYRWK